MRRSTIGARAASVFPVAVGPPKNANFAWILLDLVLLRYRAIIDLTHAVRDQDGLAGPGGSGKDGLVQGLASARQKTLARWFGHLAKDAEAHRHDPEIRAAIEATLAEIEQARPD